MFCNICLFLEKGIYETSSVLATLGHIPQGGRSLEGVYETSSVLATLGHLPQRGRSLGGIYEASSVLAVVIRNKEIYKEAVEK